MTEWTLAVRDFEIPKETALGLYRLLVQTRLFEDEIYYICSNQTPHNPFIVGKGYLSTGQEAVSAGAAFAITNDDWFPQSHRDMAAHFHRGVTVLEAFQQYRCTKNCPTHGRDGNMHFAKAGTNMLGFTSHMGQNVAVALGMAWAEQYRKTNRVAITTFGEGAAQQGIIHESMNYAVVFKLPVVFLINNNRWAISVPVKEQMATEDLAQRGPAYGMPSVIVDGNDVFAVYRACVAGVERARAGDGPSLIECKTMRMAGHGTHDPATYVPDTEKKAWAARDPVERAKIYLIERQWWNDNEDKALRTAIKAEIDRAVEIAGDDEPPDPATAATGAYSAEYPVE
ncbi:MAG: thiamine pyrophosphate-dependent dehydrogenase E1 component subunit alpha [Deltaproteobacteria bacterium]|nr:thiamine pyrophosphate-dependent dehydrogenase E1 component subunit alpha [Deltaproteobacteria bacterium]